MDELTAWQTELRRGYGKKQRQLGVSSKPAHRLVKDGRPLSSEEERREIEAFLPRPPRLP
jgi:hypothetical protein